MFICMYVYAPCVSQTPEQARKENQNPQDWRCKCLRATL